MALGKPGDKSEGKFGTNMTPLELIAVRAKTVLMGYVLKDDGCLHNPEDPTDIISPDTEVISKQTGLVDGVIGFTLGDVRYVLSGDLTVPRFVRDGQRTNDGPWANSVRPSRGMLAIGGE